MTDVSADAAAREPEREPPREPGPDTVTAGRQGERDPDPFRATRWSPRVRWRLAPWWLRVMLVFAASRGVTTAIVLVLASAQGANAWTTAKPGYFEYANMWDARWYQIILLSGYPSTLPLTDTGQVAE